MARKKQVAKPKQSKVVDDSIFNIQLRLNFDGTITCEVLYLNVLDEFGELNKLYCDGVVQTLLMMLNGDLNSKIVLSFGRISNREASEYIINELNSIDCNPIVDPLDVTVLGGVGDDNE